jgi:hypothetical protein
VNGNEVTFSITIQGGGQSMTIEFTGTVEGDSATGTATMPMGTLTWTATRTSPGAEDAR